MRYASRKFIVTVLTILCTSVLAYFGKVDDGVALIFSAAITSYNVVNGWISKKDADNEI